MRNYRIFVRFNSSFVRLNPSFVGYNTTIKWIFILEISFFLVRFYTFFVRTNRFFVCHNTYLITFISWIWTTGSLRCTRTEPFLKKSLMPELSLKKNVIYQIIPLFISNQKKLTILIRSLSLILTNCRMSDHGTIHKKLTKSITFD